MKFRPSTRLDLTCVALALGTLALGGCEEKSTKAAASATAAAPQPSAIVVTAEGTRFNPPVARQSIPAGAWICDMNGHVHYAAKNKGDGKCPVCSMGLLQNTPGGAAPSGTPHDAAGQHPGQQ